MKFRDYLSTDNEEVNELNEGANASQSVANILLGLATRDSSLTPDSQISPDSNTKMASFSVEYKKEEYEVIIKPL